MGKKSNQSTTSEAFASTLSQSWAVLGGMNGADIEALAFLILIQSAKSAQEDLKAIMEDVKAINNAKQKMRSRLQDITHKALQKDKKEFSEYEIAVLGKFLFHPC